MDESIERCRRVRKMPRRYGWIDERLMSDGYLRNLSSDAVCLYVFLCVVGNRGGQSWYSDGRIVQRVRLSSLADARRMLVEVGLILWESPVYTVLELPELPEESPVVPEGRARCEEPATAAEVAEVFSEIFRRLKVKGG